MGNNPTPNATSPNASLGGLFTFPANETQPEEKEKKESKENDVDNLADKSGLDDFLSAAFLPDSVSCVFFYPPANLTHRQLCTLPSSPLPIDHFRP